MLRCVPLASILSICLIGRAFAICIDCDFKGQNLAFADFTGQNLSGANFSDAYLINAKFDGANLEGADFSGARANNATFRNARVSNAKLVGTELELVDFTGADLTGADFKDAFVRHVNLTKDQVIQSNYCHVSLRDASARWTLCEWKLIFRIRTDDDLRHFVVNQTDGFADSG